VVEVACFFASSSARPPRPVVCCCGLLLDASFPRTLGRHRRDVGPLCCCQLQSHLELSACTYLLPMDRRFAMIE